jgi:cysteine desulfurase
MLQAPINFDHHAHTPLDPAVREVLHRALETADVNVHATSVAAEKVKAAVSDARAQVAHLIGVGGGEIVFTSGATESNNLALMGLAADLRARGRTRVIVGAVEHPSVLAAAEAMDGCEVIRAPVKPSGEIDLAAFEILLTQDTGLVSVAAANHEVGVLQPIADLGRMAQAVGALFHTDLAQSAGRLLIPLTNVDLASFSAHKLHGPLGIGALYVRRPIRRRIRPIIVGGEQEGGLRAGTLSAPLCLAFGAACELAATRRDGDAVRVAGLRNRLLARLQASVQLTLNGCPDRRLPNNLNLSFNGVDGEALVMHVRDRLMVATGSACTSRSLEPSHVLLAMGLTKANAESAIRIGLGRDTTEAEVDAAAGILVNAVGELSRLNPRRRA